MLAPARFQRLLFVGAAFLSAALLFSIQPMVARLFAPLLGGAPAVWNTSLVFFQIVLLAGYAYSHFAAQRLAPANQRWVQLALLLLAAAALPITVIRPPDALSSSDHPALWLLVALALSVGLPFFVLSTQAPLLQVWLARHGRQPYFLYSASNAGSFLALIAYPLLIEPSLGVKTQSLLWAGAFLLLIPEIWLAAKPPAAPGLSPAQDTSAIPTASRRFAWVALAFIPSSLLQGVTSYLTADIASIPLLWAIPLALYLLTFVVAFAEKSLVSPMFLDKALALGAVSLVLLLALDASQPGSLLILVHLAFFTLASLFCHTRVASLRPPPSRLTEFYLWLSVGGALGGFFNALLAPQLFTHVVEYPAMVILACAARSGLWRGTPAERLRDLAFGAVLLMLAGFAAILARVYRGEPNAPWGAVGFGLLAAVAFFSKARPLRLTLGLAAILIGSSLTGSPRGRTLHSERNFFGVLRVTHDPSGPYHRLYHGTTVHGVQFASGPNRCEPLSYYYPGGGFDRIWRFALAHPGVTNVAAVGLGAGSAMALGQSHQAWSIFEIDPAIIRLAKDTRWFTFLQCSPARFEYFLGDARLRLAESPPARFDFLILDAFSSDSVPMHLLTREAFRLYRQKMRPNSLIAVHISSRNLRLEPMVANVAHAEGLAVFRPAHLLGANHRGTFEAQWLLLAPATSIPPGLDSVRQWVRVPPDPSGPLWTDDFCSLWSVISIQ